MKLKNTIIEKFIRGTDVLKWSSLRNKTKKNEEQMSKAYET